MKRVNNKFINEKKIHQVNYSIFGETERERAHITFSYLQKCNTDLMCNCEM